MGSISSILPPIGFESFHGVDFCFGASGFARAEAARSLRSPFVCSESASPGRDLPPFTVPSSILRSSSRFGLARCRFSEGDASSFGSLLRFLSEAVSPLASVRDPISAGLGGLCNREYLFSIPPRSEEASPEKKARLPKILADKKLVWSVGFLSISLDQSPPSLEPNQRRLNLAAQSFKNFLHISNQQPSSIARSSQLPSLVFALLES